MQIPINITIKEFAKAVTKQPKTTQAKEINPISLVPYFATNKPAGIPRNTPGNRTNDIKRPTSVYEILNSSIIAGIRGGTN